MNTFLWYDIKTSFLFLYVYINPEEHCCLAVTHFELCECYISVLVVQHKKINFTYRYTPSPPPAGKSS